MKAEFIQASKVQKDKDETKFDNFYYLT